MLRTEAHCRVRPMRSPVCACVLLGVAAALLPSPSVRAGRRHRRVEPARAAPSMELILSDDAVFGATAAAVGVVATATLNFEKR